MDRIAAHEAEMRARPAEKRTVEWWAKHFDADVHRRFGFESPILDVGCGTGEKAVLMARDGLEVYGFDVVPFCVAVANKHRWEEPLQVRLRLQFKQADIGERWPYLDGAFATVFSANVLEHLPAEWNVFFFKEVRRVLRPGGKALIIVPEGRAYDDPLHCQRFSIEDVWGLADYFDSAQITVESRRIHLWGQV